MSLLLFLFVILCISRTDPSLCGNLELAFMLSIVSLMSTIRNSQGQIEFILTKFLILN
uniref:Uncharacterized protein n=1 Tax=Setaria viridis TaxID=4556 RepID=A0A4V6D6V7_SETVI|nr:hypothetical protein SEVIR_5G245266v2 [Setaria viridis]